jgi:hydrogenase maturation factor
MKPGKLDLHLLGDLLTRHARIDGRTLLGPRIGEDAAAIDMGDRVLVVATDPITFATDEIGYYSVTVNANDVAVTGAVPRWFTVAILLPESHVTEQLAETIFAQVGRACEHLDISLIGGHTEVTPGLDRPLLVGHMLGEVAREDLVTTSGAQPGDLVLLSKGICIEATSIIAREMAADLTRRDIPTALIERARNFLFDPGISVVNDARLACRSGRVHAMHDITEGGLANGLHELAMAAGVHLVVDVGALPVYEESRMLCDVYGLDILGAIGSGALLIAAPKPITDTIQVNAAQEGISMTVIGRVKEKGRPQVTLQEGGEERPLPYFQRDEILTLFE